MCGITTVFWISYVVFNHHYIHASYPECMVPAKDSVPHTLVIHADT